MEGSSKLLLHHGLIKTKDLDQTPIRVQRLLIRLKRFNCVLSHFPGKALMAADALSSPQTGTTTDLTDKVEIYTEDVTRSWSAPSQKLTEIAVEIATCPDLSKVHRFVQDG